MHELSCVCVERWMVLDLFQRCIHVVYRFPTIRSESRMMLQRNGIRWRTEDLVIAQPRTQDTKLGSSCRLQGSEPSLDRPPSCEARLRQ